MQSGYEFWYHIFEILVMSKSEHKQYSSLWLP